MLLTVCGDKFYLVGKATSAQNVLFCKRSLQNSPFPHKLRLKNHHSQEGFRLFIEIMVGEKLVKLWFLGMTCRLYLNSYGLWKQIGVYDVLLIWNLAWSYSIPPCHGLFFFPQLIKILLLDFKCFIPTINYICIVWSQFRSGIPHVWTIFTLPFLPIHLLSIY